jgi:hypothetical protein
LVLKLSKKTFNDELENIQGFLFFIKSTIFKKGSDALGSRIKL